MKKPILYYDMDDTICNFTEASDRAKLLNPDQKFPQSQWGFFLGLKEIDRAIESISILGEKYDIWILTRPSTKNINCYSEKAKWVLDHLGQEMVDKLILCPNKALLKGDYLVDDKIWEDFEGEQIHFGSDLFPDWTSVINYLLK